MTQTVALLTAGLGILSAILTGCVTHLKAPSQVKALVLLAFSLLSGAVVQTVQAGGWRSWQDFVTAAAVAFAAGVAAHKGDLIAFLTGPNGLLANMGSIGAPSMPVAAVTQKVPPKP